MAGEEWRFSWFFGPIVQDTNVSTCSNVNCPLTMSKKRYQVVLKKG